MPDIRVAITAGEPAGVGPDIIAAIDPRDFGAQLVVCGDLALLRARADALGRPIRFVAHGDEAVDDGSAESCICQCDDRCGAADNDQVLVCPALLRRSGEPGIQLAEGADGLHQFNGPSDMGRGVLGRDRRMSHEALVFQGSIRGPKGALPPLLEDPEG